MARVWRPMVRSFHALGLALVGHFAAATILAFAETPSVSEAINRPITLQLQWYPQAQFAGYLIARDRGFYLEEGLGEVDLVWSNGTDRPLERVADGAIDFCTGWLSQAMVLRDQGQPLVNVAQVFQKSSIVLAARKSSGIASPADLTGRRVGVWKGDFTIATAAFFRKHRVKPEIIEINYSISPFLRGAVEVASVMHYNELHRLREAGIRPDELVVFPLADFGLNFPEDGLYTSARFRERRPEACAALVRASMRGWAFALANEEVALDVVMDRCEGAHLATNRNHQRWMLRAVGELIRHRVGADPAKWGDLARDDFDAVGRVLVEQKLVRSIPPFEQIYRPASPVSALAGEP